MLGPVTITSATSSQRGARPRQQRHRHAPTRARPTRHGSTPAVAVREAAEERAHRRLERARRPGTSRRSPRAPAPSSSSRSGASTSSVPNISPTRITSHIPVAIRGVAQRRRAPSRIGVAAARLRSPACAAPTRAGRRPRRATAAEHDLRAEPPPRRRRAPGRAARRRSRRAIAEPISSPRRSRGAAPTSQPSAPAHDAAAAEPLDEARDVEHDDAVRERERDATTLISSARPTTTVARTPSRAASQPPGSEPSSVPAG